MVVLLPASEKGRRWADRALERIREEAEAIGVSLNTDKTRMVCMTEAGASFVFLGYVVRWAKSRRSPRWFACVAPRPDRITGLLREVRNTLRRCRHLRMAEAVAQVNPIVRLRIRRGFRASAFWRSSLARLERGRFRVPAPAPDGVVRMRAAELALILEGIELLGARHRKVWRPGRVRQVA